MAKIEDPVATVHFEALDIETDRIKSYTIEADYLTSTDGFEFVLFDTDRKNLRALELQPIEFKINGNQQIIGRVDQTSIGDDGSAVTCRGRDYIADMVECNVDPTLKIKEGVSLFDAIREAAGPVGVTQVVDSGDFALRNVRTGRLAGAAPVFGFKASKASEYKPKPGDGIYQFCNRMVARFGATIQPTTERSQIQITAPHYDQDPLYEIVVADSDGKREANNVLKATAARDFSSFPTFALFTGKQAKAGKKQVSTSSSVDVIKVIDDIQLGGTSGAIGNQVIAGRRKPADSKSEIINGALYRLLYHRDTESRNQEQIERAAVRAFFERFKETLVYSCELRGHADPETGTLWAIDTMVRVRDEITDVNEDMWIASRKFSYSASGGATTSLVLWRKGALQL